MTPRVLDLDKAVMEMLNGKNVYISGVRGVGKSFFLHQLARRLNGVFYVYGTMKGMLTTIAKHMKIDRVYNLKYATIQELEDEICSRHKGKSFLLIDEADRVSHQCAKIMYRLCAAGFVIAGSGDKRSKFSFTTDIYLEPLSRNESKEMVLSLMKGNCNNEIAELVASKSLGVPRKIEEICRAIRYTNENGQIDLKKSGDIHNFVARIRPANVEKIDLVPLWVLFVAGFGALAVKVFLFDNGKFQDGYLVAGFGYLMIAIWRMFQENRWKKKY